MLTADQVFALRKACRNGEIDLVLIPGAPGGLLDIARGVADACLVDFEPVTISLVCLSGTRRLAHVYKHRARVLECGSDGELHAQLCACLDLGRRSLRGGLESALVAAEVRQVGGHIVAGVLPLGRVVLLRSGVLPDILETLGLSTIDDEGVEEVVSRGILNDACGDESGELHIGW